MKRKLAFNITFLSFICFSLTVIAQPKMKLGKVSMDNLKMTAYQADSNASALVLGETSYLNIHYNMVTNKFELVTNVHRRIKILREDAIGKWGTVIFNLYDRGGKSESLRSFKGYTINLENDKVIKDKIGLKDAFKEKASKRVNTKKFTFSNVKPGSIIDYSYSLNSDYFLRIPNLYFQYDIPVLWKEVTFDYPEYFQYKYFVTGSESPYKNKTSSTKEIDGKTTLEKIRNYWVFKDVPSIKQLSFMRPASNYRTKINYELYGIQVPGKVYENYSTSWAEINKDMMASDNFGKLLNRLGPTEEIAKSLKVSDSSNIDKILAAVYYVQSNYVWNEKRNIYPSEKWRKNIKEQKGSSADLNFTLIGILTNMGIKAHPVILSTRSNGIIFQSFPATEDFNYIITAIELDGKYVLVDPTSEFTGLNILPVYCLNGQGLMISEKGPKWIPVEAGVPFDIREFTTFKIDEELNVKADYQAKYSNYAAYSLRKTISDKGDEEKYINEVIEDNKGLNISNFSINNLKDLSKPVVEKYSLNPEEYLQEMGDLILMKSILFPNFKENPFKKDKRTFPVDFTYPRNYGHTAIIELPEGYVFDETPKNLRIATSDHALSMSIMYSVSGNKLTMVMKLNIKKTMLIAQRYDEIKSFFDNVVSKENEQIVIREL